MSRLGSFPLRTALAALERHANTPRITFDPFCGKGTTLFAARLAGSQAYGLDTGPEAVICSQAKLANITIEDAEAYLKIIRMTKADLSRVPDEVKVFFHPRTLEQIISINRKLRRSRTEGSRKEQEIATTVQAALLGILHGHASYSLSIPSAHAYAMAPQYVSRYAEANGLEPPLQDVRHCLLTKLRRCFRQPLPPPVKSQVKCGRAQEAVQIYPHLVRKVDCVLTSPPYLASHTYAKDNWLRQWLLGYDYRELASDYLQTGSMPRYAEQMRVVIHNIATLLRPGGRLICIIGHGRLGTQTKDAQTVNLQRLYEDLFREATPALRLDHIETESVLNTRRYLHALKATNGHHGDIRMEYTLIATKAKD